MSQNYGIDNAGSGFAIDDDDDMESLFNSVSADAADDDDDSQNSHLRYVNDDDNDDDENYNNRQVDGSERYSTSTPINNTEQYSEPVYVEQDRNDAYSTNTHYDAPVNNETDDHNDNVEEQFHHDISTYDETVENDNNDDSYENYEEYTPDSDETSEQEYVNDDNSGYAENDVEENDDVSYANDESVEEFNNSDDVDSVNDENDYTEENNADDTISSADNVQQTSDVIYATPTSDDRASNNIDTTQNNSSTRQYDNDYTKDNTVESQKNRPYLNIPSEEDEIRHAQKIIRILDAYRKLSQKNTVAQLIYNSNDVDPNDEAKLVVKVLNAEPIMSEMMTALRESALEKDRVQRVFYILRLNKDISHELGGFLETIADAEFNNVHDQIGYSQQLEIVINSLDPKIVQIVADAQSVLAAANDETV